MSVFFFQISHWANEYFGNSPSCRLPTRSVPMATAIGLVGNCNPKSLDQCCQLSAIVGFSSWDHLSEPIPADWRSDHRRRHPHRDCRCQLYPPVPFPVPIGHWLPPPPPELVGFWAQFPLVVAAVVADHPDIFAMPLSIDPDHRMALGVPASLFSGPFWSALTAVWVVVATVQFITSGSTVPDPHLLPPHRRAGFVSGHFAGAWGSQVEVVTDWAMVQPTCLTQLSDPTWIGSSRSMFILPFRLHFLALWGIILDIRQFWACMLLKLHILVICMIFWLYYCIFWLVIDICIHLLI